MSLGEGRGYIILSKKRMRDAALSEGDRPRVELRVDASKYGMKMPAELKELLAQDTEGKTCFNALTRGNQRYIIHYVSQPKSEALRLERELFEFKLVDRNQTRSRGAAIDRCQVDFLGSETLIDGNQNRVTR